MTVNLELHSENLFQFIEQFDKLLHTANVYRELQGLYRAMGVQGFQIYGDCGCISAIPVILKSPHFYLHCNICMEFDFTGILRGFPALDIGKPCNNLIF